MPLVFGVLGLIVLGSVIGGKARAQHLKNVNYKRFFGRTSSQYERCLVDYYVKMGYELSDAVYKAQEAVRKRGYDSCLWVHDFKNRDKIELVSSEKGMSTHIQENTLESRNSWQVQGRL